MPPPGRTAGLATPVGTTVAVNCTVWLTPEVDVDVDDTEEINVVVAGIGLTLWAKGCALLVR
jgi:hypothetical protein